MENIVQYFFIAIHLLLLSFFLLILFATKRAVNQTKIPIPPFWKRLMIANLLFILGSIIFITFISP